MSQVQVRAVTTNPSTGASYTVYTVPAGYTLFIAGLSLKVLGATTTQEIDIYNSALGVYYIDTIGITSVERDFTKPVVVAAGQALEMTWAGTGSPSFLVADLLGTLA